MNYVAIPGVASKANPTFTKDTILDAVCSMYAVTAAQLESKKRDRCITYPRQMAIYLMLRYAKMTLKDSAAAFHRDHTTAIHSRETIEDLMDVDDKVREDVITIVTRITENNNALATPAPTNGTANF